MKASPSPAELARLRYDNACQQAKPAPPRHHLRCMASSILQPEPGAFQTGKRAKYPIGVIVRVRMISGTELEGQVTKIETTTLGTFLHVEYDYGVINVTSKQILGYYDFSVLKLRGARAYA